MTRSSLISILSVIALIVAPQICGAGVIELQPAPGLNDGSDTGGPDSGKDTVVKSTKADENFGALDDNKFVFGRQTQANGGDGRALIRFDLSSLPSDIQDAKLVISLVPVAGQGSSTTLYLYRVTEDWDEMAVTWNTQPAFDPTPYCEIEIEHPAEPVPLECDLTSLYNEWKTGTANYGILLDALPDSGPCSGTGDCTYGGTLASDYLDDPTLRPKLVVQYPDWGEATPAEASVYGSETSRSSGRLNHLAFFVIPLGAVIALRARRRRR